MNSTHNCGLFIFGLATAIGPGFVHTKTVYKLGNHFEKGSAYAVKNTFEDIFALSQEVALRLSAGEWTDFLQTAAWNAQYPFISQLLIYAQKPGATACASYGVWTEQLSRVPRKGTGIALIQDIGDRPRLQYVFDISDTFAKQGTQIGQSVVPMGSAEKESPIRQKLAAACLSSEAQDDKFLFQPPEQFYRLVAQALVKDQIAPAVQDLLAIQNDCGLKDMSANEVSEGLQNLITESVSAMLQIRSGIRTPIVNEDALSFSRYFNSIDAVSILGTTTQIIANQAISEIAHTIRQWDLNHKEETSHGTPISAGGRASTAQFVSAVPTEWEQVRTDAQTISEKSQTEPLHHLDAEGRAEQSSLRNGTARPAPDRNSDGTLGQQNHSTTSGGYDRHSSISERPSENGRSTGASGDGIRISEDDIQRAILVGPPLEGGKFRLHAIAGSKQYAPDVLAELVRREYGTGQRSLILSSGIQGTLSWDASGLCIMRNPPFEPDTVIVSWLAVAEMLQALTSEDRYLDATEKHAVQIYHASQNAREARQRIGETVRVFLSIYSVNPLKQDASVFQEHIRAYVYENSDVARQVLLGKLLELRTTARVESDPVAQDALRELYQRLSSHTPDPHTLPSATDAGLTLRVSSAEEPIVPTMIEDGTLMLPISSEAVHPGMVLHLPNAVYTVLDVSTNEVELEDLQNPLFTQSMPKKTLDKILQNVHLKNKVDTLPQQPKSSSGIGYPLDLGYYSQSVHTLRTALCSLIRDYHPEVLEESGEGQERSSSNVAELESRVKEFVDESAIYAAGDCPVEVDVALRTIDDNAAYFATLIKAMSASSMPSVSRAGQEAAKIMKVLYGLDQPELDLAIRKYGYGVSSPVLKYSTPHTGSEDLKLQDSSEGDPKDLPVKLEPEVDHPELMVKNLFQDIRKDKVVLADLLLHYCTYRGTFHAASPDLGPRDAAYRQEQLSVLEDMTVSEHLSENLAHIRLLSSLLTRWFLPFDGVRPEILEVQDQLLNAAEEVLLHPPQEVEKHRHNDIHEHIHIDPETIDSTKDLSTVNISEETLWDFQTNSSAPPASSDPERSSTEQPPSSKVVSTNFRTTQMHPHYGGLKQRFRQNLAAISLLKTLETEGRTASQAEQEILNQYVGWGGLSKAFDPNAKGWEKEYEALKAILTESEYQAARASTLTAFYTPPIVIDAIYQGLEQLGISSGNILDAGCGIGSFFGQAPEGTKAYGIEIDSISGRIAKQLYPDARIDIEGFENTTLPDHFFHAMVGNVPFGNMKVFDPKYNLHNFQIHDYFLAKGLDKVQPGGILAVVTSTGTLDKQDERFRRYLSQRADLVGAIRLPNHTFRENAGTEVSADILFLRKRSHLRVDLPDWVGLEQVSDTDGHPHLINTYFTQNPHMVLGQLKQVSGPYGFQSACVADPKQDLEASLQEAVHYLWDTAPMTLDDVRDPTIEPHGSIPADPTVPNYSFTVVDNDVYFREDSEMYRMDLGEKKTDRIKCMVKMRDIVRQLIQAQQDDASDERVLLLQQRLNESYDSFAKKYGRINTTANSRAFSDDSSYYLLCSLEVLDKDREFVRKADIFTKRTIAAKRTVTHVDTPYEALVVSIGERGHIDLAFMEQLSGFPKTELLDSLQGYIFENPDSPGAYVLSANYLSGNILEKLNQAKEADFREPGRYTENIFALEKAMPEPVGPGEIMVRLGATWVPPDIIRDFMYETLRPKVSHQDKLFVDVFFSKILNQWLIKNKGLECNSWEARGKFGTSRIDAYTILEQTLNLRDVRVFDTTEDGKQVLNIQETVAAQEKQEMIRNEFLSWVWKDPARSQRLCSIYNEIFNNYKPPEYDGDILTFHGMSPLINLRKNQKDVIARILFNGNTQIAAAVGAGKTWMMTAAAMEGKYLGHCSKSMIAVPNHLVGQWAAAIYELYPAARVLAVTQKDFEPAKRKRFCSRIATGDYDIVVIGHSQLEKIPLSADRQKRYIQDQIDEIMAGIEELKGDQDSPFTVKQLESKKQSLERTMRKLTESKKKDNVVSFEDLGVDRLFVDESDEFKNLYLYTKMQNVAGLAQTDAQKASDLFLKCRYLDELTGGKGNIHATGTPVSNTMAEIYTTQRYLQYDTLKRIGIHNFDAWASNFAEAKPVLELAPEGTGYRMRNRLINFYNLPELMGIYRQVAEIQTHDTLELPLPKVHYVTKSLPASPEQKQMVQDLAARAEAIRNGEVRPEDDNMLCVINDGRKLALDQRLMDPSLSDHADSKLQAAAKDIYQQWLDGREEKLTQLVFCDLSTPKNGQFNIYDALREMLIEKGIPADEIRFIHEATTSSQKEALFSQVRDGSVRILMGSTSKMGTGTNVQDLLIAGHHLDCPWRPRDLTQRDGRIIRIGNQNPDIYIYRYVTEGTFDAYMYQLLESKQRIISQVFTSKTPARQIEDLDQTALSFAEIKGIASGDPLIKERVGLQLEVSKLELLRSQHIRDHARMENELTNLIPAQIRSTQKLLDRLSKDIELLQSTPARTPDGKYLPITVRGQTFENAVQSGNALVKALDNLTADRGEEKIGTYRGFDLIASKDKNTPDSVVNLYVKGVGTYPVSYSNSGFGTLQKLNHFFETSILQRFADAKTRFYDLSNRILELKHVIDQPFSREAELQKKTLQLKSLDLQLKTDLAGVLAASPSSKHRQTKALSLDEKLSEAQAMANTVRNYTKTGVEYQH